MRKVSFILIAMTAFIMIFTETVNAMTSPKTIYVQEEPYFISYNNDESFAVNKLITYKQKSYLPIKDAAQFLGLTVESRSGDLYLTGEPTMSLANNVIKNLPKESVDTTDNFQINPKIAAHAGIVIENGNNSAPIFSKNAHQRLYPSSTTKIMTALLALEKGDLTKTVHVGNGVNSIPADSSKAGIKKGDRLTLEQLLYATLIPSGNDAAAAVAEYIGGSQQEFVKMMNEKAKELGAHHTSFTNAHGYHHPNLYTTAADLALIAGEAAKHPAFLKIAGTAVYSTSYQDKSGKIISKTWKNTNQLVNPSSPYYLPSVEGGKTGYTDHSRHNLVSFVKNADHQYIVVLLRGENKPRYVDTRNLINAAFTKRAQLDRDKTFVYVVPFDQKVFVNHRELPSKGDLFMKDGQTYMSTDLIKDLSPTIQKVKVSDTQEIKATLNDELLSFGQSQPIIQNGRMLVPVRSFFERMGLELLWDPETGAVEARSGDKVIQLIINEKNAMVNGQGVTLDVPATIQNGRTLVPIRFISETTGSTVDWGRGRTIHLN